MTGTRNRWSPIPLVALLCLLAQIPVSCPGQEVTVLGAVEKVVILPWGLALEARVDTGAAKSSLAAFDLRVKGKMAEFRLPDPGSKEKVRLPVLGWVEVRTNLGKEKRPVVRIEICVAGKRFQTLVNLDDRSGLRYPMLLGRESLRGRFLVDVGRTHLHPTPCNPTDPAPGGSQPAPFKLGERTILESSIQALEMSCMDIHPEQQGTPREAREH
jgi:hypothetical protein